MTEQSPLPRVSPLHREEIAKIEVGQTAVRPGVARALMAFLPPGDRDRAGLRNPRPALDRGARHGVDEAQLAARARRGRLPRGHDDRHAGPLEPDRCRQPVALADMAAFEDALEDESLLGRSLRPGAQLVLSGALRAGNERVYIGREGWLFFRPDTEYVTSAGFLDSADCAVESPGPASGRRRRNPTLGSQSSTFTGSSRPAASRSS
jgi:hypothetical protein